VVVVQKKRTITSYLKFFLLSKKREKQYEIVCGGFFTKGREVFGRTTFDVGIVLFFNNVLFNER
jgi:hypothetical protein